MSVEAEVHQAGRKFNEGVYIEEGFPHVWLGEGKRVEMGKIVHTVKVFFKGVGQGQDNHSQRKGTRSRSDTG